MKVAALLALISLLLSARAWGVEGEALLQRQIRDHWYGVYLNGSKIGHGRVTTGPGTHQGARVWQVAIQARFSITLRGKPRVFRFRSRQRYSRDRPWRYLGSDRRDENDGEVSRVTERVKAERMEVLSVTPSGTRRRWVKRPRVTLMDAMRLKIACAGGAKPGLQGEMRAWSALRQQEIRTLYKVQRVEPGRGRIHVRHWEEQGEPLETILEQGSCFEAVIPLGGGILMKRVSRAAAMARGRERAVSLSSFFKVDRPLGFEDAAGVERCVLLLPGLGVEDIIPGPRVSIAGAGGGVRLTLDGRGSMSRPIAPGGELPREARLALRETRDVQSGHKEIREQAAEILGAAGATRDGAEKIVRWVHQEMLGGAATERDALSILRNKRGDCSEYALLAVALGRAGGIPAQVVGGITYGGDRERQFVSHAWVRFFLHGRWVEMDPALAQVRVDATHVRLHHGAYTRLQGQKIKVLAVGEGPGIPTSVAMDRSLERLEYAARKGDHKTLDHLLHLGLLARRAMAGVKASAAIKRAFLHRVLATWADRRRQGQSWGQVLGKQLSRGGDFKLLRKWTGKGEVHGLFRVVEARGDIAYLDLVLRRIPSGPVKVVDVWNYAAAEPISRQVRRLYLRALARSRGEGGKEEPAPPLVLHGVSYRHKPGADSKTIRILRRLDRRVGGDPLLKVLVGDVLARQGKTARALEAYGQAARADPELVQAHNGRARVLARLRRWDELVRALMLLKERFDFNVNDLSDPIYSEFLKTPHYRALQASFK